VVVWSVVWDRGNEGDVWGRWLKEEDRGRVN
jgi:hypothetical protein